MMNIFKEAGFKNTLERELTCKLKCGTVAGFWTMITEIADPFVAALNNGGNALKEKIKEEVYELVNEKYPERNIIMDGSSIVIYGEK